MERDSRAVEHAGSHDRRPSVAQPVRRCFELHREQLHGSEVPQPALPLRAVDHDAERARLDVDGPAPRPEHRAGGYRLVVDVEEEIEPEVCHEVGRVMGGAVIAHHALWKRWTTASMSACASW